ncbi:MAG: hypothetical protein K0R01_949, partial [Mycobacterium sp.]|nr:hypothetical protein [Mycobacterium sp.]
MQYSNFVGRVGALAVALGVGTAIATPAGVAWASPEAAGDSTTTASQETGDGAPAAGSSPSPADTTAPPTTNATPTDSAPTTPVANDAATTAPAPTAGSATTVDVAPGVIVSHSGGAQTSTYGSNATEPTGKNKPRHDDDTASRDTTPAATISGPAATSSSATEPKSPAVQTTSAQTPSTATTAPAAPVVSSTTIAPASLTPTPPAPAVAVAPVQNVVSTVLSNVVAPALTSWLSAMQRGWTESPLAWMFLAAARREIGTAAVTEPAPTAMRLAAAQVVATAVVNQAPTATATFLVPNPLTGAVTGTIVASDPEGVKPTITLTTKPAVGTFVYNATTATFTYTPTTAQRFLAAANPTGAGTIAMTVTVSDGVNKVPVQINVPIAAIPMGVRTDIGGVSGAGAITATNTRVYVTNRDAGTVTVIDTVTAKVVGTYSAGTAPDGVAVRQDGKWLYVSSSSNNTVTVLDTATGAIKATIAVANPTAITMSPTDAFVSVISYSGGAVLRINAATNTVTTTTKLPVGYRPTGIAASPDNTQMYLTAETPAGGTVLLSYTPTSTKATVIKTLASRATVMSVGSDSTKLYVGAEDASVSVIDLATRSIIRRIKVGDVPTAVAVSRDLSALMVTDRSGRVAAFNTATGAMLGAVAAAAPSATQRPRAVVSPDGTELYVTDGPAGVVHVISLTAPNSNPAAGTPTTSAPNATTGAITGALGVTDPNGDPLSYTVSGAPTKGNVVVAANGTFTYTPSAAARHNASTVGAPASVTTDTFTVTVTDGRRGVVTTTVTVSISPTNKVPTVTSTVGAPSIATGVVTGNVTGVDPDNDALTYTPSGAPTKGTLTVTTTGAFTYTPTAAARHAAQKLGATAADKEDTFTITVNDGHGGVVTRAVTVSISPTNVAPTGGA